MEGKDVLHNCNIGKENVVQTLILYVCYLQIEREREEHLKPRLNLQEMNQMMRPASPESDHNPPEEMEPEESEENNEEDDSRDSKLPPKMQSTLRPVEENKSMSSVSDEDSNFPPEDLEPVYGPSKEESNGKIGFGSLKFGRLQNNFFMCVNVVLWYLKFNYFKDFYIGW